MASQGLNSRMLWTIRLHHDPARLGRASRPPRHLLHDLEGSLGGPKVGQVDALVWLQDPNQSNPAKVVPFGHHLGSDENINLSAMDSAQNVLEATLASVGRVPIQTSDAGVWEALLNE